MSLSVKKRIVVCFVFAAALLHDVVFAGEHK